MKKKSERENLQAHSDQIIKLLFSASSNLVFILDESGIFVNVNNGALMLDYSKEELLGRHFLDFISFKNKAATSASFREILLSRNLHTFECIMISRTGREINFEINARSIISENKIVGMVGIAADVTKRKNYENTINELNYKLMEANRLLSIERSRSNQRKAILEELNNLRSEFISNISHELRTPLASIIGFSETIASDPQMPLETRNEFNEIILKEGKRLAKLINDILDLSKIESGEVELIKTEFDVISALNEVIDSYQKQITSKKLRLTLDIPPEEILINADREKISRVFSELLSNAIKFTNEHGRIAVVAQNLYREFEVIISDTGAGIPEKDLSYVFQKFFRVSRPGTEIPGTGLGLVFVKQIVDLHKGFVSVQSEINKGTSFIIKLPKNIKSNKSKG